MKISESRKTTTFAFWKSDMVNQVYTKISQLPAAAHAVDGTELMEMDQDGVSRKIPISGLLINSASFVMTVDQSSVFPQSRYLVAGTNINLVDSGPGGALTINASGGTDSFGNSWNWTTDANNLDFQSAIQAAGFFHVDDDGSDVNVTISTGIGTGVITLTSGTNISLTAADTVAVVGDTVNITASGNDVNISAPSGPMALSASGAVSVGSGDAISLTLVKELNVNSDPGTNGQVLTSAGPGAPPVWQDGGGATSFGDGWTWATSATGLDFSYPVGPGGWGALVDDGAGNAGFQLSGYGNGLIKINNDATGQQLVMGQTGDLELSSGNSLLVSCGLDLTINGNNSVGITSDTVDLGAGVQVSLHTGALGIIDLSANLSRFTCHGDGSVDLSCTELNVNADPGAAGQVLRSSGNGVAPVWSTTATSPAPANAASAGAAGSLAYDASFLYVCIAANTWKRVAIAAF
jgi:hypothetical protein